MKKPQNSPLEHEDFSRAFSVGTDEEHPLLSEQKVFVFFVYEHAPCCTRSSAENVNVCFQPSLCCCRHLFGRPTETHSAWLSSAQRRADRPVMSSVYISVGRRRQELLRFSNAARVLLPLWDSQRQYDKKVFVIYLREWCAAKRRNIWHYNALHIMENMLFP